MTDTILTIQGDSFGLSDLADAYREWSGRGGLITTPRYVGMTQDQITRYKSLFPTKDLFVGQPMSYRGCPIIAIW